MKKNNQELQKTQKDQQFQQDLLDSTFDQNDQIKQIDRKQIIITSNRMDIVQNIEDD
ncbi:unnamed protein product [Paramecium sonneborni]|uniref:Uncharacterized protein n=1 Tax=Paramecium sonneborni TaxID=65129 RepID=A0A8S1N6S3_9CILI|nr:unnamed protein product [Paramecium sonneborni]